MADTPNKASAGADAVMKALEARNKPIDSTPVSAEASASTKLLGVDKQGKSEAKRAKKIKRTVTRARACILATENNTIITITDLDGKVLGWASSGSSGFKGSRKSTPYAARVAAEKVMTSVVSFGIQSLAIEIKGIGPGREQAIRGLQAAGVNFDVIMDRTPITHGGCRPRKPRRV